MGNLYTHFFSFIRRIAPLPIWLLAAGTATAQAPQWKEYTRTNEIKAMLDEGQYLWVGTWGGLIRYEKSSGNYRLFTKGADGLPSNTLETIVKNEKDESIWIGTYDAGIAFFDGSKWKVFNTGNSPLPSNVVLSIKGDADGTVWVGTKKGLARVQNGKWTIYNQYNSGLKKEDVWAVNRDAQGHLWVGSQGGIYEYDGTNWTEHPAAVAGYTVKSISCNTQGKVLVSSSSGLWQYDGHLWRRQGQEIAEVAKALANVRYALQMENGEIWAGTQQYGLVHHDGQKWEILNPNPATVYNCLDLDLNGKLMIGTDKGMMVAQSGILKPVEMLGNTLPDQNIRLTLGDSYGGLWAATATGLFRYDKQKNKWTVLENPLGNATVYQLFRGRKGEVWVGNTAGLAHWDRGAWNIIDSISLGWNPKAPTAGTALPDGRAWVAFNNRLAYWNNEAWSEMQLPRPLLEYENLNNLSASPNGELWIISSMGAVFTFKEGNWREFSLKEGTFPMQFPNTLTVSSTGQVWSSGYSNEYAAYTGNGWDKKTNYLQGTLKLLEAGQNGKVWVGRTNPTSLWLEPNNDLNTLMTPDNSPLPVSEIQDLYQEENGDLLIATQKGLLVYNSAGIGTGIQQELSEAGISMNLYPNPAQEQASIRIENSASTNLHISIFDLSGRVILEKNLGHLPAGVHTQSLDLQSLAPGMYTLQLQSANKAIQTQKLVRN